MRLGSREGCYKCSSAELGKRLGNGPEGTEEEEICRQSTSFSVRHAFLGWGGAGVVGCDKDRSEKMEVESGNKFSVHVLKQHKG